VLFEDDFSNIYSGWGTYSVEQGSAFYYNGLLYIIANPYSGRAEASYYQGQNFSNFILDVDTTLVSGSHSNWQFISCRDNGSGNTSYHFAVSADGYYCIDKFVNGLGTSITSPTASIYIEQGVGFTNHITIECIDSNLRLSVNGHLLSSVTDSTLTYGVIALCASARGDLYTEVAYDNIVVTAPPNASDIIAIFLYTNPVYSLLSEEKNIFEAYSYLESTKEGLTYDEWVVYWNQRCSLRVRAVNNLDALTQITPPPELSEFWSMLVEGELSGALPMLCEATASCVGAGPPAPMADWLGQQAIEKNMEAWLELSAVCAWYGIYMPWSLPVVY
jgi:hypothetical protein